MKPGINTGLPNTRTGFGAVVASITASAPGGGGGDEAVKAHIRTSLLRTEARVGGAALRLEHLSPSIGTVVHGADLARPLGPALRDFLRALWLERRVLFFRGQAHVTQRQHILFAEEFGVLGAHHGERGHVPENARTTRESKDMSILASSEKQYGAASKWHSDATWQPKPPMASLLFCRQAPPVGGDTLFCDSYAMYEGLPARVKARLPGLRALHRGHPVAHGANGVTPEAVHPMLRTHPETGGTTLYVSHSFTKRVEGVSEAESRELIDACLAQAGRPEYCCRFRWEPGSLAMWDNRACQHYASGDYWPFPRRMERVCVLDADESRKVPFFRGAASRL